MGENVFRKKSRIGGRVSREGRGYPQGGTICARGGKYPGRRRLARHRGCKGWKKKGSAGFRLKGVEKGSWEKRGMYVKKVAVR